MWWYSLWAVCFFAGFLVGVFLTRWRFIKRQKGADEWALIAGKFRREADAMRGRLVELEEERQEPEEDEEDER